MAIVFTHTLDETVLLKSYVNNIVQFSSDNSSASFKCSISVSGIPNAFEITPRNGLFYFNFKEIFKKLIRDYFEDDVEPFIFQSDLTSFIYDMSSIYKAVSIIFSVSLENGSVEMHQLDIKLIQSTSNFQDRKKREVQVLDSFAILSQLREASNRTFSEVYFEGYPFDIQAYKNNSGNVTITNKTIGESATFNLPYKINRIFFSDTETDIVIEDVLPLFRGVNELEFDTGDLTTLFLEMREGGCGEYLKWKNEEGGWSYWLFEELVEEIRDIEDKGYVSNDYQDLNNNDFIKNIGKISKDSLRVGTLNVEPEQRRKMASLADSPKVYLFMGREYSTDIRSSWLSVRVLTDTFPKRLPKNKIFDLRFDLELPERNTMTL